MQRIAGIVLAAGGSSRMGRPKQLLEWNGRTLLENAVTQAGSAGVDEVFVVLGAAYEQCKQALKSRKVSIVRNSEWETGMAASIRAGVAAALDSMCDGVLFLLVDHPAIPTTHFRHLAEVHIKNLSAIVASAYKDTVGVPAIFPSVFYAELLSLTGDQGAKRLIMQHRDKVIGILCPEAEWDWDTPQDAARFGV